MEYISVIPAYGRDYKTKAETLAAWNAGKDFMITSIPHGQGRMISIRDMNPDLTVSARYNRGRDVIMLTGPAPAG